MMAPITPAMLANLFVKIEKYRKQVAKVILNKEDVDNFKTNMEGSFDWFSEKDVVDNCVGKLWDTGIYVVDKGPSKIVSEEGVEVLFPTEKEG